MYTTPLTNKTYKSAKRYIKEWESIYKPLLNIPGMQRCYAFDPDVCMVFENTSVCIPKRLAIEIGKLLDGT